MVHRKTGAIGPVAPIYKEDWPFNDIPAHEILWRYMEFYKFQDLLDTSTLYFTRPDRFKDPFEGRFSSGNVQRPSKSEKAFRDLYKIASTPGEEAEYHDVHRNVVFILCWHRNTRESSKMWKAYTNSSPESVAITTSGRALRDFVPQNLMKSSVKYHQPDVPRTEFGHNTLFFYKPEEYRFEREYRILRSPQKAEEFNLADPNDEYRRVPYR